MAAPTLATERLTLRQLRLTDAAALFPALSDAEVMTWWSSGPHASLPETETYLASNAAEDAGHLCWAITTRECDDALGWVILIDQRPAVAEIGFILRRDAWGQGVAREAVARVVECGFRDRGLRRIYADVDPDNRGSILLLERLGFVREGCLRAQWETHIGIRDSLIFGMLRDEWSDMR